jgi:acetoin utilization protein AcuB
VRGDSGNLLALPATMLNLTVQKFMTPLPYTISHDQSLADAHHLMREHDVRHLPVLKDGRLAGVISQRDLYMIGTLHDIDLKEVPVADAVCTDIYAVGPRTSIRKITEEMLLHRYGSAIVMDGDEVLGIFTATDALRALNGILTALPHIPALADRAHAERSAKG